MTSWRGSKSKCLLIVSSGLFVDAILLSVVIPILPDLLGTTESEFSIGLLFASKAMVQIACGPISGWLVQKQGSAGPLFVGMLILLASTVTFAFAGPDYSTLLGARAVQGIGSSFVAGAGMALLADIHSDDKARGEAMGSATAGVALGVLLGPPFGGGVYHLSKGIVAPFLIISGLAVLNIMLQVVVRPGSIVVAEESQASQGSAGDDDDLLQTFEDIPLVKADENASGVVQVGMWKLIQDPYVLLATSGIVLANSAIALLEPTLPLWLQKAFCTEPWETGLLFLAPSIGFAVAAAATGSQGLKWGRRKVAAGALTMIGVSMPLISYPQHGSAVVSIPALFLTGVGIGGCEASINPMLGAIIDNRYPGNYGGAFALADMALSVGFVLGPMAGPALYEAFLFDDHGGGFHPTGVGNATINATCTPDGDYIGYSQMLLVVGGVTLAFAPMMLCVGKWDHKLGEEGISVQSRSQRLKFYTDLGDLEDLVLADKGSVTKSNRRGSTERRNSLEA